MLSYLTEMNKNRWEKNDYQNLIKSEQLFQSLAKYLTYGSLIKTMQLLTEHLSKHCFFLWYVLFPFTVDFVILLLCYVIELKDNGTPPMLLNMQQWRKTTTTNLSLAIQIVHCDLGTLREITCILINIFTTQHNREDWNWLILRYNLSEAYVHAN